MKAWKVSNNQSIATYLNSSYEKYRSYERFVFVKKIMEERLCAGGEFLDIGCAKGEFIWYLKDFFPLVRFTGIDISEKLLLLAKRQPKLSDVSFIKANAKDFDLKKEFNFVFMCGVLSIFDDFRPPLRQMMLHLKMGGWGYIFGGFTEEDIDVLVRHRNNYLGSKDWESGLSMFSLNTIKKALTPFSDNVNFYRFGLSNDLAKEENPIKSYTLNTIEKGRIILNGANILRQFYLVEFKKTNLARVFRLH